MRIILSILLLAFFAVGVGVVSQSAAAAGLPYPQAKVYAVEVWAQWCPSCKVLGPKVEDAFKKGGLLKADALLVRMDFTDKAHIHQSKLMARSLGIDAFLKANGSGTGYLAIIDAQTKEELVRFNRDSSVEDIISGIEAHIE